MIDMASGGTTFSKRVSLFRLQTLIIDGGTVVLRNIFDQRLPDMSLYQFLCTERTSINRLRAQGTISKQQYDLLYPKSQRPNSSDFNITLLVCLLRNLQCLGLNRRYQWNIVPHLTDMSLEADLVRLKAFRDEIAQISSTFQNIPFEVKWTEVEQVLHRLNSAVTNPVPNLQETFDRYKNDPLDPVREDAKEVAEDESNPEPAGMTGLIPAEILRMDTNSIEVYKRALREGKESVHNIRVMVVGHFGVGKTTLTKRLFGEDVDIAKRESTNGIDVHVRRCRVSLNTGQWKIIDKEKKQNTAIHRLIKVLKTPNLDNINSKEEEIKMGIIHDDVDEIADGLIVSVDSGAENHGNEKEVADNDQDDLSTDKIDNMTNSSTVTPERLRDENTANHLKTLIEEIQQHPMDDEDSATADLSVWDFAGQFAFYATHQTFLSRRAVYLLVIDISKNVQDTVEDDTCYTDSTGSNKWKISEYVDFWLNSIHEFCGSTEDDGPPVILIGTFADKLNPETKAATVIKYFLILRHSLVDKVTYCHIIEEDYAIDNSVADTNVEKLRKQILDTVSKQKYWGESIPAKWITLENIFDISRDESLKVLSKDKLHDLNNNLPVPIETEELELFLRFQHDCGNILYFSDEKLQDSIILDPQWLIDAFKSLNPANTSPRKLQNVLKQWNDFDKSAILRQELVDIIWDKEENGVFHEYKDLLLDYFEKLGFIAKPLLQQDTTETADYYFAPCVPPKCHHQKAV